MDLRKTSLVLLYILFIFHLQYNIPSVSSRPSLVATNHETASKPDVVGFEGKARELAVVIKKGGGGGGRGGGGGGGRGGGGRGGGGGGRSRGGGSRDGEDGGGSMPRGGGGVVPIHHGGAGAAAGGGSHRSSGSMNFRGTVYAVGWFGVSVLVGLFMV